MSEYFHPNEVHVAVIDGKRTAFLKPNWQEIREKVNGSIRISFEERRRIVNDWEWDDSLRKFKKEDREEV